MSKNNGHIISHDATLEEGDADVDPEADVSLMYKLAPAFDTKRALPTPTVIHGSRLDLLIHPSSPTSRLLLLIFKTNARQSLGLNQCCAVPCESDVVITSGETKSELHSTKITTLHMSNIPEQERRRGNLTSCESRRVVDRASGVSLISSKKDQGHIKMDKENDESAFRRSGLMRTPPKISSCSQQAVSVPSNVNNTAEKDVVQAKRKVTSPLEDTSRTKISKSHETDGKIPVSRYLIDSDSECDTDAEGNYNAMDKCSEIEDGFSKFAKIQKTLDTVLKAKKAMTLKQANEIATMVEDIKTEYMRMFAETMEGRGIIKENRRQTRILMKKQLNLRKS
ncbi:hypothetical protein J6590_037168 [Homalodisca vitripennis]|nr:hypothetical protein J6590_037168 [Homalodisca vitripennis]